MYPENPMQGRKYYTDKNSSPGITLLTTIAKLYKKLIKMMVNSRLS